MLKFREGSPAFIFILCLLALLIPSAGDAAAEPSEFFEISRIRFDGNTEIKKKEILATLSVKPPAWWKIWAANPSASREELSEETDRILRMYKSSGFYHANVRYSLEVGKGDTPKADVTYVIEEGAPAVVEQITIEISGKDVPLSERDLLRLIPLKPHLRFEEKAYRASRLLILREFGARGYPMAEVSGKVLVYPATNRARISFTAVPGARCFFGETVFAVKDGAIQQKILDRARTYQPGDLYDINEVEKTQKNLYDLDVFKAAVIEPESPDPETGRTEMTAAMTLKKRRNAKLGAGYGDEDGVRLKGSLTYRNLWKNAGKLTLETKRSDLLAQVSAGYQQPFFWDADSALQIEGGMLQETLDSYDSNRVFTGTRFTRKLTDRILAKGEHLLEYSRLQNLNLTDPLEREAFRKDNTYFISSVLLEICRDTTEENPDPKEGSILTGSLEIAPSLLGSELTYVKPSIEFKQYTELPFQITLADRIKFQVITDMEKNGHIPVFKRLFLGGANTVRGYSFQMLGPLDATGNPEGGLSTVLANIELRRHILGKFSAALFLDMGMVSTDAFHYHADDLRYGAGGGIRMETPAGPLRLDVGVLLNPPEPLTDADGNTTGTPDRWRIHFNIGHAF